MKALSGAKLGEMSEDQAADLIAEKLEGVKTSAERLEEKGIEYETDNSGALDKKPADGETSMPENPKTAPSPLSDADRITELLQQPEFKNAIAEIIKDFSSGKIETDPPENPENPSRSTIID